MSLNSRKIIHSYKWYKLPIGEYVIEKVDSLMADENKPLIHNGMNGFEWTSRIDISNDVDIETEQVLVISNDALKDANTQPIQPLPLEMEVEITKVA